MLCFSQTSPTETEKNGGFAWRVANVCRNRALYFFFLYSTKNSLSCRALRCVCCLTGDDPHPSPQFLRGLFGEVLLDEDLGGADHLAGVLGFVPSPSSLPVNCSQHAFEHYEYAAFYSHTATESHCPSVRCGSSVTDRRTHHHQQQVIAMLVPVVTPVKSLQSSFGAM